MSDILEAPTVFRPDHCAPLIPIFTYGTLRVGRGNYSWCAEAVKHTDIDAVTHGRIYFVSPGGGYPVAKFDEPGVIQGDILWFDPEHPTFNEVVSMEVGAGYEVMEIIAVHGPEEKHYDCFGFHYRRIPGGPLIESGDWVKEAGYA